MVQCNSNEAHDTIFCIPLFLPPSHTKYSPHHPALTNPQSVVFSWCKTLNFTPTQNYMNNVCFIDEHMQHSEVMVASIAWTYSSVFFFSKFMALNFCQDLTYNKQGLWKSDKVTSQAMWHNIQIARDFTIKTTQNSFSTIQLSQKYK